MSRSSVENQITINSQMKRWVLPLIQCLSISIFITSEVRNLHSLPLCHQAIQAYKTVSHQHTVDMNTFYATKWHQNKLKSTQKRFFWFKMELWRWTTMVRITTVQFVQFSVISAPFSIKLHFRCCSVNNITIIIAHFYFHSSLFTLAKSKHHSHHILPYTQRVNSHPATGTH